MDWTARTSVNDIVGEVVEVTVPATATGVGVDRVEDGSRSMLADIVSIVRCRRIAVVDGRVAIRRNTGSIQSTPNHGKWIKLT